MSGHSKWSTIKRKKGANDAKRGQRFTKLIKEITVAARMGGGDPNGNPRLRSALATARANSMPGDNIDRAIKKGTGELEGVNYEEIIYEGYGPAGVALIIEAMTDNKNRTVADLRNIFSKRNGNLGGDGCVAWMFEKKGCLSFDKQKFSEDALMDPAIEAGADDVKDSGSSWDVLTSPADFEAVRKNLAAKGLATEEAEITLIPKNTVKLNEVEATKLLALIESLDEHDDVQKVHANFDISEEIMEKISEASA